MIPHSIALDARETVAPEWDSTATLSAAYLATLVQMHTSLWSDAKLILKILICFFIKISK